MFQKKKILLIYMLLLTIIFIPNNVYAATYNGHSGTKIYYNGSNYTYYNKKMNGKIAYCAQLNKKVPNSGYTYSTGWNKYTYNAFVAAQIIKIGKSKYSGQNQYLYIQYALNCYLKLNGYYGCGTVANNLIKNAKEEVAKYHYVSKSSKDSLPKITVAFSEGNILSNTSGQSYVSKKGTLSGMVTTYGDTTYESTKPSYTITVTASNQNARPYICTSASYDASTCSPVNNTNKATVTVNNITSYDFYIILLNGGTEGGSVSVSVSGTNKSKYATSVRWNPNSSIYQSMITAEGNVEVSRSVGTSALLTYTKSNSYTVSLRKVDENGTNLPGASLTLYTASDANGTNKIADLCTINASNVDNPSCSKNDLKDAAKENDGNGYQTGNYLCYSEGTEPSGYKKIATHCQEIRLSETKTIYSKEKEDGSYGEIEANEYYKYMHAGSYCITNTENNFDDAYVNGVVALGVKNNDKLTVGACDVSGGNSSSTDNSSDTSTGDVTDDGENPMTSYSKTICVTNPESDPNKTEYETKYAYDSTGEFCAEHGSLTMFVQTNGSVSLTAVNALNLVNISKKAITGADEVPGAKLSIYTTDKNGNCTKNLAKARKFEYQPFTIEEGFDDEEEPIENNDNNTEQSDSTSDSDSSDNSSSENTSSDDSSEEINIADALTWESSYAPAIISGINAGTYCLIEEIAPKGYKRITSTVKFSMGNDGTVTLVDDAGGVAKKTDNETNSSTISMFDEIIDVTVSKTDATTSKELPGATLSICEANKNDNGQYEMAVSNAGDCTVVTLSDGTPATWVSTDKPHVVHGLGSGTYYLVETIAPKGYSTAESILFVIKEDGTLTDINGKALTDSKLVMHDKVITDSKTGMLGTFIIIVFLAISGVAGAMSYYKLKQNTINNV